MHFAREAADRVVFMEDGMIVEQGPPERILSDPSDARTKQFLRRFLAADGKRPLDESSAADAATV
jgi:ABC-type polar amino acid transport system ATPase subunit